MKIIMRSNLSYSGDFLCDKIIISALDEEPDVVRWTVLASLSCLALATVVLNVGVISAVNRNSQLKPQTRFLLTSMAAVDLLVGIVLMPVAGYNLVFDDLAKHSGRIFCDAVNALDVTLSSMSIFHFTVLTLERYVVICRPLVYSKYCGKALVGLVWCTAWISILALSIGSILSGLSTKGLDPYLKYCVSISGRCHFLANDYFQWIALSITIFIPGCIIVCLNIALARHVKITSFRSKPNPQTDLSKHKVNHVQHTRQSKHVRVAKIVASLTVCFLACWTPFFVLNFVATLTESDVIPLLYDVTVWIGYANSAVNPALYLILQRCPCRRI